MVEFKAIRVPQEEDFKEGEITPAVKMLLEICRHQQEQLQIQSEQLTYQAEEIKKLKDEILILKGEKKRPQIKSSNLDKDDKDPPANGGGKSDKNNKTKKVLDIHEEIIVEPKDIPEGSKFKGYEEYIVQDLEIKTKNTKYKRARYQTPEGKYIVGELPESVRGTHFGVTLRSFIISQYYEQHVTQNLIHEQLLAFGVQISEGQINHILTEDNDNFHEEKEELLKTGLEVSSYIGVDDTGARHKGKNGVCTRVGNELFTYFLSTESKSRINFLEILRACNTDYVVDDIARIYMKHQKLPKEVLALLVKDLTLQDKTSWKNYLDSLNISKRCEKIVTEGALYASAIKNGLPQNLVITSDEAGQFVIFGMLNSLCWVHVERNIKKIIPFTEDNRLAQKLLLDQLWSFYKKLRLYKISPTEEQKQNLTLEFESIFSQKTCFQTLNIALKSVLQNKNQLLLVLDYPQIPLHNNLSENDIRDYVKKRKISATTRSDLGRKSKDSFLSLKKTCRKLNISFWNFLLDRIALKNIIPKLACLIRLKAQTA